MKMTRKLFPALIMLLVSAVMLSTASYAWFASNSTVAAGDMHVKVKSDAKFLEISKTSATAEFSSGVDLTNEITAKGEIELVHAKLTDGETAPTLEWQIGESNAIDSVGEVTETLTGITENYALINTLWVRMSPTSTANLSNLRIKADSVTVARADEEAEADLLEPALRVLVVAVDDENAILGAQIWSNSDKSITTYNGTTVTGDYLVSTVTKTAVKLMVYVFYDGADASATTANTTNLQELVVGFSLTAGAEEG